MKSKLLKKTLVGVMVVFAMAMFTTSGVYAAEGFSMSPMKQSIILDPGESYQTSVTISNPGTNDADFKYKVEVKPFYVDDNYNSIFEEYENYSQIVDWITLNSPNTGSIEPNESREILFTIDVPSWAPGGGQYASILISSDNDSEGAGMLINENVAMGHIIYAEITGKTSKQGEFLDMSLPGIVFSGYIGGSSAIKNTGNTHGEAKYTLQVYPLFSDEEVYSNAETPYTHLIIPGRTYYDNDTIWPETPVMGVFNVVYTVEYEGVVKQVSKMVIKCPIYLLFVVLAVFIGIIIWIVMRIRSRRKK